VNKETQNWRPKKPESHDAPFGSRSLMPLERLLEAAALLAKQKSHKGLTRVRAPVVAEQARAAAPAVFARCAGGESSSARRRAQPWP
jgi:hypothetical protein